MYPRYSDSIEKDEPFRTRITAGGDRLEYFCDVSTDSTSMEPSSAIGNLSYPLRTPNTALVTSPICIWNLG